MVTAIIQARMGSSRLPGKVLKEIMGKPMLWHLINRIKKAELIDEIVIATSTKDVNKPILELAESMKIDSFAGSEDDVLDRYYQAAKKYDADIIVRLTADCPLIDPELVDRIIGHYLDNQNALDYVQSGKSYPDGIVETSVMPFKTLEKIWQSARLASEREHVTPYIWNNPQLFRTATSENNENLSHMRLCVDDENDFKVVSEVFNALYKDDEIFHLKDILNLLRKRPEILELNIHTIRDEGYQISLNNDKIVR